MRPETVAALLHVQHSARLIRDTTKHIDYDDFVGDELLRLAVERSFEIIGEAVNRIGRHDQATIARISEAQRIVALRNVIVHGYDVIKYSRLWEIIHSYLPNLLREVEALLDEADRQQSGLPDDQVLGD
jgi:uncharacterized protein with HEPN domain